MKVKLKPFLLIMLIVLLLIPASASAALPLIDTSRITNTISNAAAKLNPSATPKPVTSTPVAELKYDGTQSDWAEKELIEAFQFGLTYSDIENNFQKPITREEFCTIAVRLYEKLSNKTAAAASTPFTDTNNQEIAKAYGLSIVKGTSDSTFSPELNITRQEICVMILRTLTVGKPGIDKSISGSFPFDDASQIASWALDAMKFAYAHNIMKGTSANTISPLNNTSREQAIVLLKRTYVANSGTGTLGPAVGLKPVFPNSALKKFNPAGTGSGSGKSELLKLTADPLIILRNITGNRITTSESAGFPLKSTDSGIAGVDKLGRGYNVINAKYADDYSFGQYYVLDIAKLLNDGRVYKMDASSSGSRLIEGTSASSYSQQYNKSVSASGNYLFFGGSVKTNFSESSLTEKNRKYATLLYEAPQYSLYFDDLSINLRDYLAPSFKNDINTLDPVTLFNRYGTHVVRSLNMGGRLDYNVTSNSTYNSSQSSFSTDVKASFNAIFAKAGAAVETSQTTVSSNFYSNTERTIKAYPAYGGTDLNPDLFSEWFDHVQKEPGVSEFGANPLIPIWTLASGDRVNQLEAAYKEYAASNSNIQAEYVPKWGINGIKIQRFDLGYNNVPANPVDENGDEWHLVGNIAAHCMLPNDDLVYIYVRYGWCDEHTPPVTGIFMENETQGEDAITIFQKLYGNDPTARLWGYAGENVLDSGLFQYINTEGLGDKITLLYVTSLQKEPIKQIRIKHINPKNGVSYYPPEDPADDATFHPVIDMGTKMNYGTDEPQNCDEGAPDYFGETGWFPGFTVYKNHFIEYSHE